MTNIDELNDYQKLVIANLFLDKSVLPVFIEQDIIKIKPESLKDAISILQLSVRIKKPEVIDNLNHQFLERFRIFSKSKTNRFFEYCLTI